MDSPDLPSKDEAFQHYDLDYEAYGILIFHPVTTEIAEIEMQTRTLMRALVEAGHNMIVIESNNDDGSEHIRGVYEEFRGENNFRFFPSMRFEFFLSILKSARFMIGNSSAGIREAPHYGVPAINLGSRQLNRVVSKLVINCELEEHKIVEALLKLDTVERVPEHNFGTGNSAEAFRKILANSRLWDGPVQKQFVDIEKGPRG
jgi:UDP-N-acetylglucosamine 2-epimerase (hydrolysing)